MSVEAEYRALLPWAMKETVIRMHDRTAVPENWTWNPDDVRLHCLTDDGEYRFHVRAVRDRRGKTRIAVLSVEDDNGKAEWEAEIPADLTADD